MSDDRRDFFGYLRNMITIGASDLHLKVGAPPTYRIDGVLFAMEESGCSASELEELSNAILTRQHREVYAKELELDIAFSIPGTARYRVNFCCQRGTLGASFRLVPMTIPSLSDLGLPGVLGDLVQHLSGLLLVTGATGTGKSTTVAAMLDHLNHVTARKIVTVEDPIEYLHRDDRCLIYQREVGNDTHSFAHALKHILRQDPDVVMIAEIRDVETLMIALQAANTGHLVITTLQAADVVQALQRLLAYFPPHQQHEVRRLLADNLRAVVSQRLVPLASGQGRLPAVEVMVNGGTIREYLVDPAKTALIREAVQAGAGHDGMQSFDQALVQLVQKGLVAPDVALRHAARPNELALQIRGLPGTAARAPSAGRVGVDPPVSLDDLDQSQRKAA